MLHFFITGHKGFETALFHEVRDIVANASGDNEIKKVYGGVEIRGALEAAYRVCLYSRLANRVYLNLKRFKADNEEALYQQVYDIDWSKQMSSRHSFLVSTTLSRSNIDHSHYAALKVKDAVVDYFRNTVNSRPIIEKERPDVHIHVNIHQNNATLSLDLSGQSLHRRGYRLQHSGAPLKENLAAALLAQSGWTRASSGEHSLIDPMCGSGTFAIEAAMIAANIPPGLDREHHGFTRWAGHDAPCWKALLEEAEAGIVSDADCQIVACDADSRALDIARDNALRAGVEDLVHFKRCDIAEHPLDVVTRTPIILVNPPYGERLQAEQGLAKLYMQMGKAASAYAERFSEARFNVISANPDLLHRLRLKRRDKKNVKNGQLSCVFASFDCVATQSSAAPSTPQTEQPAAKPIDDQESAALRNRLQKNDRHLGKWARRSGIDCYRVYDADLPEFSFALDRYCDRDDPAQVWFHLQEYQAPKTIDPARAAGRIAAAQKVVRDYFGIDDAHLFSKLRQRQRGRQQYDKQDQQREFFSVSEGDAKLLVNLSDYLDTGLFLDHRITRGLIRDEARDKAVLNLFCYTASVSVQAALGGASQVVSADMSPTYLHWAQENFALNDLQSTDKYRFIEADCLQLLRKPAEFGIEAKFDLIFLDPPSFSNSKKMSDVLDIQRDHNDLVRRSMRLLAPSGKLYFSTNKKGFRLEPKLEQDFAVEDITAKTIDQDFKRRSRIHQCWIIRQKSAKG